MTTMDNRPTPAFPHPANARNSDKILALRIRHKAEGYAVYFMLLERLCAAPGHVGVKDYNMLAFDLRTSAQIVKSVVEDFGLFDIAPDGSAFTSDVFAPQIEEAEKRRRKSLAGMKGMAKRWGNDNTSYNTRHNTPITPAITGDNTRYNTPTAEHSENQEVDNTCYNTRHNTPITPAITGRQKETFSPEPPFKEKNERQKESYTTYSQRKTESADNSGDNTAQPLEAPNDTALPPVAAAPLPDGDGASGHARFCRWIADNAPYIASHFTHLLSERELEKLKADHDAKLIADTILQIENRKDLRKRYTNLYRTLLNWLKNGSAAD